MGLFDNIKDKYQDHQEKAAEQADNRGNKLASLSVQYMGGYGEQKKAVGSLTFYQKQTEFKAPLLNKKLWFTIANTNIADIKFDGKDDVVQQRTITRNLLLAGKSKKQAIKDAYLSIVLADGQEAIFHAKDTSPMELKAKLASAVSQVRQGSMAGISALTSPPQAQGSTADELAKLAQLKQQGVITQAEFDKKKAQLLGL